MTSEERDLIARFIARVGGAPQAGGGFTGSVPATAAAAPLPPVDREADAFLADLFQKYPEARYRISQLAYVQEQALNQAANRINGLQAELQQAKQAAAQAPAAQSASPWGNQGVAGATPAPQPSRGFFGSLFGGGQQAAPPPQYAPQPGYQQPQYQQPAYQQPAYQQPGMLQSGGSGFFGSALTTAAGVAGGLVAGNALMNLFEGHHGGYGNEYGGGFGGGGFGAPAGYAPVEVVPQYIEAAPVAQPWGSPGGGADPFDVGGAAKADPGYTDTSSWTDTSGGDSGWTDTSDSGWTDTSDNG